MRQEIYNILVEENRLLEIVKLIGSDVLPDDQKLILETAKVIRVGFLQQNAFHKDDTYVPMDKQLEMMRTILLLNKRSVEAVKRGVAVSDILKTGLFDKLTKIKYEIPNDHLEKFAEIDKEIESVISALGQ